MAVMGVWASFPLMGFATISPSLWYPASGSQRLHVTTCGTTIVPGRHATAFDQPGRLTDGECRYTLG